MHPRCTFLLPLSLAALALGACQNIGPAPSGAPRIEVEVVCAVDDGFVSPLAEPFDKATIERIVRDAVEPLADVGLRFYPVASAAYEGKGKRPEYVLTVRAQRLDANRRIGTQNTGPDSDPQTTVRANLSSIESTVATRLERRRTDGPALTVGDTKGKGSASPRTDDATPKFPLHKVANETNDTEITERMLRASIEEATKRALYDLQRPIDRELKMLADKPAKPAS